MALLNIRSLTGKTFLINELIRDYKLDCMFLTETWLDANGSPALIEASPPNYSFSQSFRSGKKGGGTATIFSEALTGNTASFDEFTSFEYHAITLKCKPPILAVTVYRPPKKCPSFFADFSEFLSIIHTNFDKIIISGDFNLHVDVEADSKANEFINLLNSMDFVQHISEPTHNRGHTLDLVITKGLKTTISSIIDPALSDHYCIFFTVKADKIKDATTHVTKKRFLTPEVAENFKSIMMKMNTTTTNQEKHSDSTDLVTAFNTKISRALDMVAPLKQKK